MIDPEGNIRTDEEVQEMIRQTIERCGRFVLCAEVAPQIGEVQMFAGLPFRVVRFVSYQACTDNAPDIWGADPCHNPDHFHFEVEVAD